MSVEVPEVGRQREYAYLFVLIAPFFFSLFFAFAFTMNDASTLWRARNPGLACCPKTNEQGLPLVSFFSVQLVDELRQRDLELV